MSDENLHVKATFTASDQMSPVVKKILDDMKRMNAVVRQLNASFSGMGKAGHQAFAGFDRAAQNVTKQMRGLGNTSRNVAKDYAADWRKANEHRLNDARRMYSGLERMESSYQRSIERRIAEERKAERAASRSLRSAGGGRGRIPSARSLIYGGVAVGAGVGSALKKRMDVEAAEVRAQMFGDLSKAEVQGLRKNWADRAGIKYGVGTTKALDVAMEGLKAGISKGLASDFGDLVLQAQGALDIDVKATANFMGKLSTQLAFNKVRYKQILNAVAVANNATAANGDEIVESLRQSLSVLTMTTMTPEQLAAIDATNISIGVRPGKSGNFLSHLFTMATSADSSRGQRKKDLRHAANALGFGGLGGMAQMAREKPVEFYTQLMTTIAKLPAKLKAQVARELGGDQWADEILSASLGIKRVGEVLKEVASKPGFIDVTSLKKIRSMAGRWASISAAFGLVVEKVGAGFETIFGQISDSIIRHSETFNFNAIRDHMSGFLDGLRDGFGLKSWGEMVDRMSEWFKPGSVKQWREFATGLAEGVSGFISGIKDTFTGVAKFLGYNPASAKEMGKLIGQIGGLVVALTLLSPVISVLASFASVIANVALAFSLSGAAGVAGLSGFSALLLPLLLASAGVALQNKGVAADAKGQRPGDRYKGFWEGGGRKRDSGASGSWTPRSGSPGASGSWSPATQKAAASFSPASYASTGGGINSAEYDRMFAGTALAGRQSEIEAAARVNGIPPALLASVVAHETGKGRVTSGNNVAGLMSPDTGYRTKQGFATMSDGINAAARVVAKNYRAAGGDLTKMGARYAPPGAANDPRGLNGNWTPAVSGYMAKLSSGSSTGILGKNPADIMSQYLGLNEYRDTAKIASFIGRDPRGNLAAWCASAVNASLKAAGITGTGTALASDFGKWGKGIPVSDVQRGDVLLQTNGRRIGQVGMHVGLSTGRTRMVNGQLQVEMLSGNDGDSVKTSWRNADKLMARRSIQSVPPADAIANVPPSSNAVASSLLQRNGDASMRQGAGHTFHITGVTDPEAVATAVQRRIDESMNWRTHDTASEYT